MEVSLKLHQNEAKYDGLNAEGCMWKIEIFQGKNNGL